LCIVPFLEALLVESLDFFALEIKMANISVIMFAL
jgi:hypothetical protein